MKNIPAEWYENDVGPNDAWEKSYPEGWLDGLLKELANPQKDKPAPAPPSEQSASTQREGQQRRSPSER
jgi:hypothetical protein